MIVVVVVVVVVIICSSSSSSSCFVVVVVVVVVQPVNTTRVNAADITTRVTALQSDKDRSALGKAGFFEEFEVLTSCTIYSTLVFIVCRTRSCIVVINLFSVKKCFLKFFFNLSAFCYF